MDFLEEEMCIFFLVAQSQTLHTSTSAQVRPFAYLLALKEGDAQEIGLDCVFTSRSSQKLSFG